MDDSVKLSEIGSEPEETTKKSIPFREAMGCLNYIATISRPDVSFAVNALARHSNNPKELHWRTVKKVMRYLKGRMNFSVSRWEYSVVISITEYYYIIIIGG